MTDVEALLLGGCVWAGVLAAVPLPRWWAVLLVLVAVAYRRPRWLMVGGMVAGSSFGAGADQAYRLRAHESVDAVVTAVGLPVATEFGERVTVRLPDGDRVLMSVPPSAGTVRLVRAGQPLAVQGSLRPIEPTAWSRSRHLVGRLDARSVALAGAPGWVWRVVAGLQTLVDRSAQEFSPDQAALYRGLVTGDDRDQGAGQRAVFRAVGLSHLLAVSGQNVAFVLVVAHVLLRFVPRWCRVPAVMVVLVVFALLTQLEPSVLRATVTAGIGYWAVVSGRARSGVGLLGLAVTVLLLVDPFLARSTGFQLSVGASLGILAAAPALANRLPGPPALRAAVAVTLAAQLAVSPLLLGTFGSVSAGSVPANLLAGWAAGLVMMWGMSAGLVAGLIGGDLAAVLQSVPRALVWWIETTAEVVHAAGFPVLARSAALVLVGLVLLGVLAWPLRRVAALLGAAMVVSVFGGGVSSPHTMSVGDGSSLFVSGEMVVLVVPSGPTDRLVDELVAARVRAIDVVIALGGNRRVSNVVGEIAEVVQVETILGPPQHRIAGARRVLSDVTVPTEDGPLRIIVESPDRLDVRLPP